MVIKVYAEVTIHDRKQDTMYDAGEIHFKDYEDLKEKLMSEQGVDLEKPQRQKMFIDDKQGNPKHIGFIFRRWGTYYDTHQRFPEEVWVSLYDTVPITPDEVKSGKRLLLDKSLYCTVESNKIVCVEEVGE